MTHTFDDDLRQLLTLTRDLLSDRVDEDYLRSRIDQGEAHSPELWRQLADIGLVSALVSEERGGAGLGVQHLAQVLQVFGEHAVPEPFLETAVVAVSALQALPDSPGVAAWLDGIAAGEVVAAVEFEGRSPHIAYAGCADVLLRFGADGTVRAFAADEFSADKLTSVDPLRPVYSVATRADGELLGTDADVVALAWRLAVAGSACQLAGVSRHLLDMTVDYVQVRHQFGRPVGSFQGVKHKLASVAVKVDMASAASASAFESAVDDVDGSRAATAKAYSGEAGELANVESLQLHGGIGFTWEYPLHMWMKRAMSLGQAYGTMTTHRRDLARRLLAQV